MYSNIVMDHFAHPRNVGELDKPDAVGKAKNEADGDQVQLHLSILDGRIEGIFMKVMGCVVAIAATSLLTEIVKGKMLSEAEALTKEDLAEALGGIPEQKKKCSLTCIEALKRAISQVENRPGL